MEQLEFVGKAKSILSNDPSVIGLAVGGSWINQEIDQFSDVDLVIVTKEKITDEKEKMVDYAKRLGDFLSGFTGEHVGEPRLLVCLYENPLLHVDLKFVTLEEFHNRVENPTIIFERAGVLKEVLSQTSPNYPYPDYQWIEDRFWIWIHYFLLKIGRGEYMEAYDGFSFLRGVVLGPLFHIKNKKLPRGVRKIETELSEDDLDKMQKTLTDYNKTALLETLRHCISLYKDLRSELFSSTITYQKKTEEKVMEYFNVIESL